MNKDAIPLAVRRDKLVATTREALQDQHVLVGVSGGVDSIALLLLCCAAASQQSAAFQVTVAHIHHGLRATADEEQQLVEALCVHLGIKCICKKVHVQPINGSIAAGARKVRYDALVEIALACNIRTIAVAHHACDQLETMLMALCRGGGLHRLAGMTPSRELANGIMLVRPLLHVDKSQLEAICCQSNITWCNDPTNDDTSTPRGRLRKDVIPVLRQLWPAADRHAANASTLLQAASDAFDTLVPQGTQWSRKTLSQFPLPVIAAAVHGAIGEHATFETVQSIARAIVDDNTDPREFACGHGCVATVTAHQVEIIYT